jgi:hypothetical protein
MELRGDATTEVRKGGGMSKGPDLSAFPIPRKGGAKPIAMDEAAEVAAAEEQRGGEATATPHSPHAPQPAATAVSDRPAPIAESKSMAIRRTAPPEEVQPHAPTSSGQTVATTVKLDENRYLRLADAGKPGPGRLKRRTIQEMVIEALDEWFERRGI